MSGPHERSAAPTLADYIDLNVADAQLSERDKIRVTLFRLMRRVYLRVESGKSQQQIDRMSLEVQNQVLHPWHAAIAQDCNQIIAVLDQAVAQKLGRMQTKLVELPSIGPEIAHEVAAAMAEVDAADEMSDADDILR